MGNPSTSGLSLLLETKEESALQCGIFFPLYFPIHISYVYVRVSHIADLPTFPGFPLVAGNLHDNVIHRSPLVPLDGDIPQRVWTDKNVSY